MIDFRVRVPPGLCPAGGCARNQVPVNTMRCLIRARNTRRRKPLEDLIQGMDNNGVDHAVIHAEHEVGDAADALNRTVADIVEQHPSRFTGIGTISLENFTIKRALQQIEQCAEMGMIGLSIEPAFFGLHLDDKKLYPIYAKAMEKNLLVALHTGINYTTHQPMAGENPILLDEIACDFPDLTLSGLPWWLAMDSRNGGCSAKTSTGVYRVWWIGPKYVAQRLAWLGGNVSVYEFCAYPNRFFMALTGRRWIISGPSRSGVI